MEKQSVKGMVVRNRFGEATVRIHIFSSEIELEWPYSIPEGTPVTVTVEIGGRKKKEKP